MKRISIYCSLFVFLCACKSKTNTDKADNKEVTITQVDNTNVTAEVASQETMIADIQKEIQKIKNASLKKAEARYSHLFNPHDGAQYIAYYDEDQLVKLSSSWGEGPYSWTSDYYLKDGDLFFYYHLLQQEDGLETQTSYYVNKNKIIKGLIKEGTPPLVEIENKPDPEFTKDPDSRSDWLQKLFKDEMVQYQLVKPTAFQKTYTKDEKEGLMMDIRKEFERIAATSLQRKVKKLEITSGLGMGETIEYEGFFDKGKLVRFSIGHNQSFYLKDDLLFFMIESNYIQEPQVAPEEQFQSKYYFHDYQMIDALIKWGKPSTDYKKNRPHPCLSDGKSEKTLRLYQELELARARVDF